MINERNNMRFDNIMNAIWRGEIELAKQLYKFAKPEVKQSIDDAVGKLI